MVPHDIPRLHEWHPHNQTENEKSSWGSLSHDMEMDFKGNPRMTLFSPLPFFLLSAHFTVALAERLLKCAPGEHCTFNALGKFADAFE